jgi:hypothetical protein
MTTDIALELLGGMTAIFRDVILQGGRIIAVGLGQIYPSERVNIPSAEYPF